MDLASGYSDAFNYGNGYTPMANTAINNNNLNYLANQNYANQVGKYDPFAQSGGFGAMTDYYSALAAAYGRNTGGFNASPGANPAGTVQRGPDLPDLSIGGNEDIQWMLGGSKGPRPSEVRGWGGQADQDWVKEGSQGDRPSTRPDFDTTFKDAYANQQKAIDTWPQNWDKYFGDVTKGAPQPQWEPTDPYKQEPAPQNRINNPTTQGLLGYTPNVFGGQADVDWMRGGSQGPRPSSRDELAKTMATPQPNNLPQFWQGVRDMFGADPKDQSRISPDNGGYPLPTNPNYQPGGMTPQQPWQVWQPSS